MFKKYINKNLLNYFMGYFVYYYCINALFKLFFDKLFRYHIFD